MTSQTIVFPLQHFERAARPGQYAAVQTILARLQEGERYISIVLPTRYGKSDVIRVATWEARRLGLIALTVTLSPFTVLADQLVDRSKWTEAWDRYRLPLDNIRIDRLTSVPKVMAGGRWEKLFAQNGEMLLSATTSFAYLNLSTIVQWISAVRLATGLPVLVAIDECHQVGEGRHWSDMAASLVEAGAVLLLLTATPHRDDNRRIPGFEWETEVETTLEVLRTSDGPSPDLVTRQVWRAVERRVRLVANHETTFKKAWLESPSPLCNVSYTPFSVDVYIRRGEGLSERVSLADLSWGDAHEYLGRIVRSRQVIREGVTRFVQELRRFKALGREWGGMIFCGSDRPGDVDANAHARAIRAVLKQKAPEMSVGIATATETEETPGKAVVKAFEEGLLDVLIVKFMGGAGLDVPRAKVLLDLSPVRAEAACIQRWMRVATPDGRVRVCVLILPDDVIGRTIFKELVEDQGGRSTTTDLEELLRTWNEQREYGPGPETEAMDLGVDGTSDADFEDAERYFAERQLKVIADQMLDAFPELTMSLSHAQVVQRCEQMHVYAAVDEEAEIEIPSARADEVRARIGDIADDIADWRSKAWRGSEAWVDSRKGIFGAVYRRVGLDYGLHLSDVEELERLEEIEREMERERGR